MNKKVKVNFFNHNIIKFNLEARTSKETVTIYVTVACQVNKYDLCNCYVSSELLRFIYMFCLNKWMLKMYCLQHKKISNIILKKRKIYKKCYNNNRKKY